MFIHPQCPCTQASLTELEAVMRTAGLEITNLRFVVETLPLARKGEQWDLESTLKRLHRIGADREKIQMDPGGNVARKLGVMTSGHVVAWDPEGRVVFSGGITGSRGHEGDNCGRQRLLRALRTDTAYMTASSSPVFGCQL